MFFLDLYLNKSNDNGHEMPNRNHNFSLLNFFSELQCPQDTTYFSFCLNCNKCHSCNQEVKIASDLKLLGDSIRESIHDFANKTLLNIYHQH